MKACVLLPLLILLTVAQAAVAQRDSLQNDTAQIERPARRPDPVTPPSSQPPTQPADDYRNTNPLIQIRMDAIPSALKKTLMGPEYRGWENSTIFRNNRTFEFSIDIRSGDTLKTFRFDRFGNPLNPNTPSKDD